MSDNLLKKYDEIFFDKERVNVIIDELLLKESTLDIKALDSILCSYIHYRVHERSVFFPMSITLIIDINNIALEDSSESDFLKSVKYVVSELQLDPFFIEMANKKIRITLY